MMMFFSSFFFLQEKSHDYHEEKGLRENNKNIIIMNLNGKFIFKTKRKNITICDLIAIYAEFPRSIRVKIFIQSVSITLHVKYVESCWLK